jgi:hypothetical protein
MPAWMKTERSMFNWAMKQNDFGEEIDDEDPDVKRIFREEKEEQFSEYWSIAEDARADGFIEIHRVIKIPESCLGSLEQILECVDSDEVGHYWSAREEGAGSYGSRGTGGVDVTLHGVVSFEDIDWEHGFYSFIFYPEQYEIAVKHGAKIVLTGIDEHKLADPVVAFSGDTEGYIHRSVQ